MKPFISVIVPIYNMDKYLRRTLNSLMNQSYENYEVLLIDDGSTDNSSTICDEYALNSQKIKVFHQSNKGVSSARNKGLLLAKGDWVTFCDADDFVAPTWLENYRLEENANTDVICQGLVKFKQKGDHLDDIELIKEHRCVGVGDVCDVLPTLFVNGMLGWLHIKAFRLETILERGVWFDIKYKYREDEKFLFDFLWPTDKLIIYNDVAYYYQVSENNKYEGWRCTYEFSKSIYQNVRKLGFGLDSDLRNFFADEYKIALLESLQSDEGQQKQLFQDLVKLVKDEYSNIRMFPLTKFILRYDITEKLSLLLFKLHLMFKKKVYKRWI